MPLPLTVSCFSKIQIGFAFLVLAHPGSPGQRAVKCVCVCVCVILQYRVSTTVMDLIVVFCIVPCLYLCLRCFVSVSLPHFRWIKIYIILQFSVFQQHPSHRRLPFLLQDWLHGFSGLFTDTSEHIRFYFLVLLFSTSRVLVPCGRLSWLMSAFERT